MESSVPGELQPPPVDYPGFGPAPFARVGLLGLRFGALSGA